MVLLYRHHDIMQRKSAPFDALKIEVVNMLHHYTGEYHDLQTNNHTLSIAPIRNSQNHRHNQTFNQ